MNYPYKLLLRSGTIGFLILTHLFLYGCAGTGSTPKSETHTPQSQLQSLYQSCKAFWAKNGEDKECDVAIASQPEYGFVGSDNIEIKGEGHRKSFIGTGRHKDSDYIYHMDTEGNIM